MKKVIIGVMAVALIMSAAANDFSDWMSKQTLKSGTTLTLPKGVHHAYPDDFSYRYLHISNNDDGIKHIVFDLSGLENVVIDGNGAELRMHGHIIPFYMRDAKNITIKNLTIDWANPFYAQGEVTAAGDDWFEVKFDEEYPVEIRKDQLVAVNPDLKYPAHFHNLNFIDPEKGEQAYRSGDEYGMLKAGRYAVKQKNKRTFRIQSSHMRNKPESGQIAVFQYEGRTSPAISVHASKNIRVEKVTQYHAAAIANIFEGSEDIYIDQMTMKRRGSRWYSALNDATHYVDCRGDIFITNSHFEFQNDDAVNIHGIYRTVDRANGEKEVRLRLNHYQQFGVDTIQPGDTVAFCDLDSLEILAKVKVAEVSPHDHQIGDYRFEDPLPDLDWPKVAAMRYDTDVNVQISGNTFQNNRARALLIKMYGTTRIHDNYFHTPGPVLLLGYGLNGKWFESGPFNDVEVYNNTFDQCMFGSWGNALFSIRPQSTKSLPENLSIHDNKIIQIHKPIASVRNIKNFEYYDNTVTPGTDYPHWKSAEEDIVIGLNVTTGRIEE